jgi:hypothetical protein
VTACAEKADSASEVGWSDQFTNDVTSMQARRRSLCPPARAKIATMGDPASGDIDGHGARAIDALM